MSDTRPIPTDPRAAAVLDSLPADPHWLDHLAADVLSPLPVDVILEEREAQNELAQRIIHEQWANAMRARMT